MGTAITSTIALCVGGNFEKGHPEMIIAEEPNGLTPSKLSKFMNYKGYEWSNDAQVYYHYSYKLPAYSNKQAEIWYYIENPEKRPVGYRI